MTKRVPNLLISRKDSAKRSGVIYVNIEEESHTPCDWHNFLCNRSNKRSSVEFLSGMFISLGSKFLERSHTSC